MAALCAEQIPSFCLISCNDANPTSPPPLCCQTLERLQDVKCLKTGIIIIAPADNNDPKHHIIAWLIISEEMFQIEISGVRFDTLFTGNLHSRPDYKSSNKLNMLCLCFWGAKCFQVLASFKAFKFWDSLFPCCFAATAKRKMALWEVLGQRVPVLIKDCLKNRIRDVIQPKDELHMSLIPVDSFCDDM